MPDARKITINLHDTSIGIWQDDANDSTFREFTFKSVLRLLRREGWLVEDDPRIKEHYSCLNNSHRIAQKGDLRATIEVAGRSCTVKVWATTWPLNNTNGPRYDFDKFERMEYLDQKRFEILTQKIIRLFQRKSDLNVTDKTAVTKRKMTAIQRIEMGYAASWHSDKTLGRPICKQMRNATSADALSLTHGCDVWTTDPKGRVVKGQAFYNINNMWWVVLDQYHLTNKASFELFVIQPDDLRNKRNHRQRIRSIERAWRAAVAAENTTQARLLEGLRVGDSATCRIWSRKNEAYYATDRCGYTPTRALAGIYRRDEAEKECRRVPHILSLELPDGLRLTFEGQAA